jgi:RsiW-degrading membrane proteinase PrsW (M82 family)
VLIFAALWERTGWSVFCAVDYLQYVWMGYAAIVAFFYVTKKKHSNDSFFTQLLTWLLLALGSHAVTGCTSSSSSPGGALRSVLTAFARQFSTSCRPPTA